jgi:patatin-like phospholipase/acyl hydrolase
MGRHRDKEDIAILSIDGGGIRGVIPVTILAELEQMLSVQNGTKPLSSYFDLITGTSTGGLIALALASPPDRLNLEDDQQNSEDGGIPHKPNAKKIFSYTSNWGFRDMYSLRFKANKLIPDDEPQEKAPIPVFENQESDVTAPVVTRRSRFLEALKRMLPGSREKTLEQETVDIQKILNIYVERGEEIFPKSSFRQLQSIGQVFGDKYDEQSLEDLLEQIFGNLSMQDARIPVAVCTYECYSGKPLLITSYDQDNFYMKDAARATSAAPTYFSPHITRSLRTDSREYCLIDGGVAANNPALLAYFEAKKLFPKAKRFHILSLGTASRRFSLAADDSLKGGVIGWMDPAKGGPLYNVLRSSQDALINYTLNMLEDVQYYRFDGTPGTMHLKLDDASKEHIALLQKMAATIITENRERLQAICRILSEISS